LEAEKASEEARRAQEEAADEKRAMEEELL